MEYESILNLFKDLFINVGSFWNWFISPVINIAGNTFAPIQLFSIGGALVFIGIAITMWVIK